MQKTQFRKTKERQKLGNIQNIITNLEREFSNRDLRPLAFFTQIYLLFKLFFSRKFFEQNQYSYQFISVNTISILSQNRAAHFE